MSMTSTWQSLQGVVLAGRYLLEQCLGESENATLFRTSYGPDARPAVLRLIPANAAAADLQVTLWRRAAGFAHPNLLPLLDSGRAEFNGEPALYAIFECPDETLQTALDEGPLAASDALEILQAVLAALNYLHAQGLVHTAVDARHVVAVGNQIKLWTDTVHSPAGYETAADDVASLGDLLFHVLTGHPVASSQSPDLSALPDPFRSIVENTSGKPPQRRWTLAQIADAVNPRPFPRETRPLTRRPPLLLRGLPLWVYGALAVMLAVLGFFFLPKSVPQAVAPAPASQQKATSARIDSLPPSTPAAPELASHVLPPTAKTTLPSSEPVAPEPSATVPPAALAPPGESAPHRREVWRVIAYSYARYADAERKAKAINRHWPAGKAAVFSPNGFNRPPHYVALGGLLNRDQAVRLLKIARGKGLPRDVYIQNYPR